LVDEIINDAMVNELIIKNWLLKIAQDDRQAFNLFFDYYYPRLLKYAYYFVDSYENAEEVVSDVFVKLLKKKNELSKIEHFSRYIYSAVKNQCFTFIQKKANQAAKLTVSSDDEADFIICESSNPESDYLKKELIDAIRQAINNLPPKRRTIYQMIKEQGLSYQDTAELLNISKKTVEVHMGLAIAGIRRAMQEYLELPVSKNATIRKMIQVISGLIFISTFI
jgi:RNA polymerase sigma-70 factor (ECF subfamily)